MKKTLLIKIGRVMRETIKRLGKHGVNQLEHN